jgi:hypothetical protein
MGHKLARRIVQDFSENLSIMIRIGHPSALSAQMHQMTHFRPLVQKALSTALSDLCVRLHGSARPLLTFSSTGSLPVGLRCRLHCRGRLAGGTAPPHSLEPHSNSPGLRCCLPASIPPCYSVALSSAPL